jgi:SAM-dependent methyltransferase
MYRDNWSLATDTPRAQYDALSYLTDGDSRKCYPDSWLISSRNKYPWKKNQKTKKPNIEAAFLGSIQNYHFENGRRYHTFREGAYLIPNDEKEQERLDLSHHIFKLILRDRLYQAPLLSSPRHVLDFGTGTGAWAIDFATEHPETQVVGIDLSPIQSSSAPPNCRFFVDDVESPWMFETKFDYVHGRAMVWSIKDWDGLLREIYNNLEDNGIVELQEYEMVYSSDDDSLSRTPAINTWRDKLTEAGKMYGHQSHGMEELADDQYQNQPTNGYSRDSQRATGESRICGRQRRLLQGLLHIVCVLKASVKVLAGPCGHLAQSSSSEADWLHDVVILSWRVGSIRPGSVQSHTQLVPRWDTPIDRTGEIRTSE